MRSWNRLLVLAAVTAAAAPAYAQTPAPPNIVVIMTDDAGYADFGAFGATDVRTPNIDRLARDGVRLTSFYANGPTCTPTRAGFISGRYQQRYELEWPLGAVPAVDTTYGLPPSPHSMPRQLQRAGYRTALVGKWHLGWKPAYSPLQHGFDEFFGFKSGYVDFYQHTYRTEADLFDGDSAVAMPGYMTDLIADRSIAFIERNARRPFFIDIAFNAPHWPYQVPGRPTVARDDGRHLSAFDDSTSTRADYVAMLEHVDTQVGRILAALDRMGMRDNTLVIFTNDNGGEWLSNNGPYFHHKGSVWEGGIRVPTIVRWPARIAAGGESRQAGMTMDLTATILAAAGVPATADAPRDGIDLLPILAGRTPEVERALFWRVVANRPQRAVRQGKWKLVFDGRPLLFDLEADPGERVNLIGRHPDVANRLRILLDAWGAEVDADAARRKAAGGVTGSAARPVTARGLDNVAAFTRLTGYVRFFYPGDAALGVNWDEFTVRGMRVVEQAPTADSLAATLRSLFASIAPEVAVYRTGATSPAATAPPPTPAGVHFWQHFGYGAPQQPGSQRRSIYTSIRRIVPLTDGVRPDSIRMAMATPRFVPVPDPDRPFVANLGGGVTARVPLALLTPVIGIGDTPARPAAATEAFSIADRATRLATVALLWMVPQHFYPYFDITGRAWTDALVPTLARAATDSLPPQLDETLDRLVATLEDGHAQVFRSGASYASTDVRFDWVEDRVVVTAVGDSAAAAGVARGDVLVAIDGRPAVDVLRDREARVSGAPQWVRHNALLRLAGGAPRTRVALTLLTAAGTTREVHLARRGTPPPERRPAPIAELRPGVWCLDLDRVTDAAVDSALPVLAKARGVVFDMRGYPRQVTTPRLLGTLTDTAIRSPQFQIPLVVAPDAGDMRFANDGWTVQPREPRIRGRIAFLSGGGAISYAESTLGVVEDNRLAPIVGEPSAGTNGNTNPIALPGNYSFAWTGMRVIKGDGSPHHGVGIQPTVPVRRTLADVRAGRDPVLEKALEIVSQP